MVKFVRKRKFVPRKTFKKKFSRKISKKFVKKVVNSMAEKKSISYTQTVSTDLANAANTTGFAAVNVLEVTPIAGGALALTQGVTQSTRVGNKVRPKSVIFKFSLFPTPYNASSNSVPMPQTVMMWLVKYKGQTKTQVSVAAAVQSSFFQNGSSVLGMTGDMRDYCFTENRDLFTIYWKKVVKLGSSIYANMSGGNQVNQYSFANNEYKMQQHMRVNLMKHGFPKSLDFSDNTGTSNNNPLFFVISPVDADNGLNASTTASAPIQWIYALTMNYTDI